MKVRDILQRVLDAGGNLDTEVRIVISPDRETKARAVVPFCISMDTKKKLVIGYYMATSKDKDGKYYLG